MDLLYAQCREPFLLVSFCLCSSLQHKSKTSLFASPRALYTNGTTLKPETLNFLTSPIDASTGVAHSPLRLHHHRGPVLSNA